VRGLTPLTPQPHQHPAPERWSAPAQRHRPGVHRPNGTGPTAPAQRHRSNGTGAGMGRGADAGHAGATLTTPVRAPRLHRCVCRHPPAPNACAAPARASDGGAGQCFALFRISLEGRGTGCRRHATGQVRARPIEPAARSSRTCFSGIHTKTRPRRASGLTLNGSGRRSNYP
jgi:hypothetical protein